MSDGAQSANGTEQSVTSGLGVNIKADSLSEDDEVLLGDRKRPLTVVDRHERPIHRRTRRDERDYHDVVELTGNGTEYHLLWQHGSTHEPILRRRSQWTETEDGGVEYSAQGERIYEIEILSDDTARDCLMDHDWCDGPDGETVDGEAFGGLCGSCYIKRSQEAATDRQEADSDV